MVIEEKQRGLGGCVTELGGLGSGSYCIRDAGR